MFEMTSRFIERIRWKIYWYERHIEEKNTDVTTTEDNETYGFPTRNAAPACDEIAAFEDDLYNMIKSIKFRKQSNEFLKAMKKDIEEKKDQIKYMFSLINQETYIRWNQRNTKSCC